MVVMMVVVRAERCVFALRAGGWVLRMRVGCESVRLLWRVGAMSVGVGVVMVTVGLY